MNPNVGENQRQIEVAPSAPSNQESSSVSVEKNLPSSPENRPQQQSLAVSSQVANDIALPAQSVATGMTSDDTITDKSGLSSQANDTDRIEKEWVDKAKTVISSTKDDPFEQKSAMSRVKADYIQKRFNKTITTDDTVIK